MSFLAACLYFSVSLGQSNSQEPKKLGPSEVVVKVLDMVLAEDRQTRNNYLFFEFANKPDEQKFNAFSTENWEVSYLEFAKSLTAKAKSQKLNWKSLEGVLKLIQQHSNKKFAYLPIAAYQAKLNSDLVWIVPVKWEFATSEVRKVQSMSHIRIFAYNQKSLEEVAYTSCR